MGIQEYIAHANMNVIKYGPICLPVDGLFTSSRSLYYFSKMVSRVSPISFNNKHGLHYLDFACFVKCSMNTLYLLKRRIAGGNFQLQSWSYRFPTIRIIDHSVQKTLRCSISFYDVLTLKGLQQGNRNVLK